MGQSKRILFLSTLVVATAGVGLGYATSGPGTEGPGSVDASQCPEANEEFERVGLAPPDDYSPDCPIVDELAKTLDEIIVPEISDADRIRERLESGELEETSGNLDQLDEFEAEYSGKASELEDEVADPGSSR